MVAKSNSFETKSALSVGGTPYAYHSLPALESKGYAAMARLPFSLKVLLENLLRCEDGVSTSPDDIETLANWDARTPREHEIAFTVARVLLQDFTGVPAVVDLAAMRDAMVRLGGDPSKINPLQPADLVIDHSVQVDHYGSALAFQLNADLEFERNKERYQLLKWAQQAFDGFRVVPPDTGIVHQVNLEYLAQSVFTRTDKATGATWAYPDTVVGTDSHTPMVNALGVVGWGVGGIEAEACMLGQPIAMLIPEVVGVKLTGRMPEGLTATDLVLTVVQMLRKLGVVGKFVEFYGPGLTALPLPDRATISNMAPEYGATIGFFPVDAETLNYMRFTGRSEAQIALVEAYCKAQGLFRTDETPDPIFTTTVELDLGTIVPSMAGPKRPQDRVPLSASQPMWRDSLKAMLKTMGRLKQDDAGNLTGDDSALFESVEIEQDRMRYRLGHGSVVLAAITSCTNTSNPSVLVAAGLVARKAVERGINIKPWVKTSLAPGSKVVMNYLEAAGLVPYLEALKFHLVGFGCTTCIGNSGPLPEPVAAAIDEKQLICCSVLSGNRNFEGRIGPRIRANYLASPPLVVAYAIAGTMDIDIYNEPISVDTDGNPVFLKDIWPTTAEVAEAMRTSLSREMFEKEYGEVFAGDANWAGLEAPEGSTFEWDPASTYVRSPPFFEGMPMTPADPVDIVGARALAVLGTSVTTDHISPAGNIAKSGPSAAYLQEHGVERQDFNSYGARRGNHEVMMRGTFANVRLRNQLAPGTEGGWSTHLPTGEVMSIYDAAMKYIADGTPLVILAGAEYGTGSSRDWAAKGTLLLGVKAVITEGYERIHRSNLIGMGVLPLQFLPGQSAESLGLTGHEFFGIKGLADLAAGRNIAVTATNAEGATKTFDVRVRLDTPMEVEYYRHGGILQYVLRRLMAE